MTEEESKTVTEEGPKENPMVQQKMDEDQTAAAEIRQVSGLTMAGKGSSNHWVVMDGKKKFGGAEAGTSPMEMVLLSLGGCTGMDVISLLRKMRIEYSDFRMTMDVKKAEEHPKIFTDIAIHYHFTGKDLPMQKLEKAVSLSQDRYCSVSAMLREVVNISYEIHVNEG